MIVALGKPYLSRGERAVHKSGNPGRILIHHWMVEMPGVRRDAVHNREARVGLLRVLPAPEQPEPEAGASVLQHALRRRVA